MTEKQKTQFNKMLRALKVIAKEYQTPTKLRREAKDGYGLDYEEALEMAYENIQEEAKAAIKNVRPV